MEKEKLYKRIIPKERDLDKIATESIKNPEILSYLLEGVQNENVRIRFGCFNTLVLISKQNPKILSPLYELRAKTCDIGLAKSNLDLLLNSQSNDFELRSALAKLLEKQ